MTQKIKSKLFFLTILSVSMAFVLYVYLKRTVETFRSPFYLDLPIQALNEISGPPVVRHKSTNQTPPHIMSTNQKVRNIMSTNQTPPHNMSTNQTPPHIMSTNQKVRNRKVGHFRGSPGQHSFRKTQPRDWYVDPSVVRAQCRETNFTQCTSPPRRSNVYRQADRARRTPFQVVTYIRFRHNPADPSFAGCDYDNCRYTGDTVGPETDAVYVYGDRLKDSVPLPAVRLPRQVFIVESKEPPAYEGADPLISNDSKWNQVFNATMTYRLDSDIRSLYGKLDYQPRAPNNIPDYRRMASQKSKTAVWMVSNCGPTPSKRMAYVKEMQKHIDIDIFGKCGEPCQLKDERCVEDVNATYKFYLAFENSFCTDYVTEKFFKLFIDHMHVIPVVRGAVDYNREFPKHSFVNAADFKGPRHLAKFLKDLAADDRKYSEYLEVKDRYRAMRYGNRWCLLCEYLHKRDKDQAGRSKTVNIRQALFTGHVHTPSDVEFP